jgi:hypothetical protein
MVGQIMWIVDTANPSGAFSVTTFGTAQFNYIMGLLNSHIANTNNPHAVTAEQAGADVSGAAAAVQSSLDTHETASNPHNITASTIGYTEYQILECYPSADGTTATVLLNKPLASGDTLAAYGPGKVAITATQTGSNPYTLTGDFSGSFWAEVIG